MDDKQKSTDEFEIFQTELNRKLQSIDMADRETINQLQKEVERQKGRRKEEYEHYEREVSRLRAQLEKVQERQNGSEFQRENQNPANHDLANALISISEVLNLHDTSINGKPGAEAYQFLTDPKNVIREFQGTEEPEKAQAWLNDLETSQTIHSWSDAVTLSIAKSQLKVAALKWLMSTSNEIDNLKNFKVLFKATFTYSKSPVEKFQAMSTREQGFKETIQEYVMDKLWLCTGLSLTVFNITNGIAAGLWSKNVADHILGQNFGSTDKILPEIIRYERLESLRRARINERKGNDKRDNEKEKQQKGTSKSKEGKSDSIEEEGPSEATSTRRHGALR